MKLVLFTPVIKSSAIARMACLITKKLVAEGHDITIVRTESEDYFEYPIHDFGSDIIS